MSKIMKYGLLALLVAGMMSSCMDKNARKNNYPAPTIPEPPVGRVYTVSELVDMVLISGNDNYKDDTIFKKDCSVYGIITADETSGNFYKVAFLEERATKKAIELYMKGVTGLRIGDSVRVCLKDAVLGAYKGLPQIQDLDPKNVIILANEKYIEPEVATVHEIVSNSSINHHLCQLVRLENVQFVDSDISKNWAEENTYGERMLQQFVLEDETWVSGDEEVMVRTSNYASFGNRPVPTGNGYLTAIVTKYNTTWQLVVRSVVETEVLMEGPRK